MNEAVGFWKDSVIDDRSLRHAAVLWFAVNRQNGTSWAMTGGWGVVIQVRWQLPIAFGEYVEAYSVRQHDFGKIGLVSTSKAR